MKADQLVKLFGEDAVAEVSDLNALDVAEARRFRQRNLTGQNYRDAALDDVMKHKLPFQSTANGIRNVYSAFVGVKCPYCPEEMVPGGSSGAGESHSIIYQCKCGATVTMRLRYDSFCATPPPEKV
jgi:hypothetical protein